MDSFGRIINLESKLAIDGSRDQPVLSKALPITEGKKWTLRRRIKSSQEDGSKRSVPKLVESSRQWSLNTANSLSSNGSLVIMFPEDKLAPNNACWKMTDFILV